MPSSRHAARKHGTPLDSAEYHWSINAYNANGTQISENQWSYNLTVGP